MDMGDIGEACRNANQKSQKTGRTNEAQATPVAFFGGGLLIPRLIQFGPRGLPPAAADWRHLVTSARHG